MLAILMAIQAGLPPLDFVDMIGKDKEEYIRAIQIGFGGDYEPMETELSYLMIYVGARSPRPL
jgi:cell filamentation protein